MFSMFPGRPLFEVLKTSGQPDILIMFVLVGTGYSRPFRFQIVHISHFYGLVKPKIRLIHPVPGIL